MFDVKSGQWVKVRDKVDLDKYLALRADLLSKDNKKT